MAEEKLTYENPIKQSVWIQRNAGSQEDKVLNATCTKATKILEFILETRMDSFTLAEVLKEKENYLLSMGNYNSYIISTGLNFLVENGALYKSNEKYFINYNNPGFIWLSSLINKGYPDEFYYDNEDGDDRD